MAASSPSPSDFRALRQTLAPYRVPSAARAALEVAVTLLPLAACWAAGLLLARFVGWQWGLAMTLPAAAFLVRLFMIQHDCGHGSMFPGAGANRWVGRLAGALTATPYDYWRRTHAVHHATSGNLDRRTLGGVDTLTVEEYRRRPWRGRLAYRAYRHPLTLFGLGPAYMFVLQHRLPIGLMKERSAWLSVLGANLGIAAIVGVELAVAGAAGVLAVHLPIVILAATAGVWLFFVQHQYEGAYWRRNAAWSAKDSALEGSSYLKLPRALAWLTADIGAHHVHHADSRIPFYRLPKVLREVPALGDAARLSVGAALRAPRLALWDEDAGRLVGFARREWAA